MRVIAGLAKRLQLKTPAGMDTRPTTDRIKETLFNMIQPGLCDCEFLDLFSGSGGIGIEALSRGAKGAVFVENNAKAAVCIEENLKYTKLSKKAVLMRSDVLTALKRLDGTRKFDYIFMDPPYNMEWEKKVLIYLADSDLLAEDAVIIIEASKETSFDYIESLGFHLIKQKEYKTNVHVFLDRAMSNTQNNG